MPLYLLSCDILYFDFQFWHQVTKVINPEILTQLCVIFIFLNVTFTDIINLRLNLLTKHQGQLVYLILNIKLRTKKSFEN